MYSLLAFCLLLTFYEGDIWPTQLGLGYVAVQGWSSSTLVRQLIDWYSKDDDVLP